MTKRESYVQETDRVSCIDSAHNKAKAARPILDKALVQDNESNSRDTKSFQRKENAFHLLGRNPYPTPVSMHLGEVLIITSGQIVEVVLF